MDTLSRQVVVITGAADGIGRALAFEAARRGMRLVLADRHEERLAETAADLARAGAEALAVATDVTDSESVENLAEATYARFGAAHVLVNNAGVAYSNSAWDTPLEQYERVIDVNLFGVIHGVRAFVPRMLRQATPGHIVNVASAAGLLTVTGLAAYCASKFAVVGFSEALYHDLCVRKAQIGVSVVCPSWVKTSLGGPDGTSDGDDVDGPAAAARVAVSQALNDGVPAAEVAVAMLDAVLANTFYVVTDPTTKAAFSARAGALVAGGVPRNFL